MVLRLSAVLASAVLFFFGTGMSALPALTWLAPLPVLLLAARTKWAPALGFVAYLLGTANSWAFQLRSHDVPMVPAGLIINIGGSITFALVVWVLRHHLTRGRPVLASLAAPALWTGLLYLVSLVNPKGVSGTFANDVADVPVVVQTAAVAGMWGVEFLVLYVPAAVAALMSARGKSTAIVALALVGVALGGGAIRLSGDDGPVRKVAAIATNQKHWAPDLATSEARDLVATYVREIEGLPAGVDTVVLPEGTVGSAEANPSALVEPLRRVAGERKLDIVVGHMHYAERAKYNYALVFPSDGGPPLTYLKHHDSASAPGRDLLVRAAAGVAICADVNQPDPIRDYAAAGTTLLLVPASDETENGWQHSRTLLVRGVEHGQATVWSARTGTLMIADGRGRVRADASTGGAGAVTTVVADVPTGPGATPYTRLGDWFAWLCLAIALGGLLTDRLGGRLGGGRLGGGRLGDRLRGGRLGGLRGGRQTMRAAETGRSASE
ncbi:nitrilase-related carbon-nitrogen hydrolase [Saccharothrix sp. NPDC042600]|uniref:nitrilase-related carbon-nitrogen hydrolase n=1 Tax=Saccharothrix TaxID=2071 RepID=UPI0033CDAA42|nr:apolipoprotein N-acyltransferase [Saccharothrix mutabilis subsp. capreolus]